LYKNSLSLAMNNNGLEPLWPLPSQRGKLMRDFAYEKDILLSNVPR